MTQRNYCFDIEPSWGSHAATLDAEIAKLAPGSLVIEHGAGMYSTPLIARRNVRPVCIEEASGWASWAKWMYADRDVRMLSRAKEALPLLADAALVFIDGAARERGDLLKWSLAAGVPVVIAHDTEEPRQYGYYIDVPGYAVAHDGVRPRTTTWRRL